MHRGQSRTGVFAAALVATTASVAWPSRAYAQAEFIPALGFYIPLGGWREQQDDGSGIASLRRQLSALSFTGRLHFPVSSRVALETSFAITPSQVAVSNGSGTVDLDGGVYFVSARAAYRAFTFKDGPTYDETRWNVILTGGLGVVHRGGVAWENTSGVTAPLVLVAAEFGISRF